MKSLLFFLVAFIALGSLVSGIMIISHPDGSLFNLPLSLLEPTPFTDYRTPGIFLVLFSGVPGIIALFLLLLRHPGAYNWCIAAGVMISCWIVGQMLMIQVLHWLQFLFLGMGALIILIAYQLKGKWAV